MGICLTERLVLHLIYVDNDHSEVKSSTAIARLFGKGSIQDSRLGPQKGLVSAKEWLKGDLNP
jgi:hypothetical protein